MSAVCAEFGVGPDEAMRYLGPAWRETTVAVMDARRAQRVVEEFRQIPNLSEEALKAQAERWRRNGDGAFFAELCRAAGLEQPDTDEL